jgi:hypothetical protein
MNSSFLVGFLWRLRDGLNEVVEFGLEGVEHTDGVLESFRFLPEVVGFFGTWMPDGYAVPRLDLTLDLDDEVFVEVGINAEHRSPPTRWHAPDGNRECV